MYPLMRRRCASFTFSLLLPAVLSACAGSSQAPFNSLPQNPAARDAAAWPQALPVDRLQPWEAGRAASALGAASEFTAGAERFNEVGDVTDLGQASRLQSGDPGAGELSFALYRIALSGQPGAIAADVNLRARSDGSLSEFYLGLSDYAAGRWEWHGPYTDHHVRFGRLPGQLASEDYLSPLGNLFLAVVAFDGSRCDVLGFSADERDITDSTAPEAPSGLTATAVAGGIALQWNDVIAADLAGYGVYYAHQTITDLARNDVRREKTLEGSTRCIIPATGDGTFIRITAVDASGNESAASTEVFCQPLAGTAPQVWLDLGFPVVERDAALQLTVAGEAGLLYDYDLDGNGGFEITGSSETVQAVDTSSPGLIRPRVRAVDEGGTRQFLGGVSLIVNGNTPPVAVAMANPQAGAAPLNVTFSGADSEDFDGEIVGGGWDFDGDGVYELFDDTDIVHVLEAQHEYAAPGLYNAKLRVVDDQGAFDVDTVSIFVASAPGNLPPQITGVAANPSLAGPETSVNFSFAAQDADGTIAAVAWDFDNDGTTDSTDQVPDHLFGDPGLYNVKLTVTDDAGAIDMDFVTVSVQSNPVNLPPVIDTWSVDPSTSLAPAIVTLSYAATDSDGSVTDYDIDSENNGSFDFNDSAAGEILQIYNLPGLYNACLRVTDDDGATSRSYLGVLLTLNQPPVAMLTVDLPINLVGASAGSPDPVLRASQSYDPENGALEYSFDPEGDGVFSAYDTLDVISVSGNEPGIFQAAVKVRDLQGAESLAYCLYQVQRLSPQVLETNRQIADPVSITALNGPLSRRIGIAYGDSASDDLRFIVSADQSGDSWLPSYVIDANGAEFVSLAQSVSQFNLAYYRDNDLFFKASQNDGQSFNVSGTIDNTADDAGDFVSCAIVSGRPAVAYYNTSDTDLYYCRASNSSGTAWGAPQLVDSTGSVGQFCSLMVISNAPCIAYYRSDGANLQFVRAANADGSSWNAPLVVDSSADDVGKLASLNFISGAPCIAYYNDTADSIRFVRAADTLGLSWGSSVQAATGTSLNGLRLLDVNGRPGIALGYTSSSGARFILASSSLGSGWGFQFEVESNNAGTFLSATQLTNGLPALAYYDSSQELHAAFPRLN